MTEKSHADDLGVPKDFRLITLAELERWVHPLSEPEALPASLQYRERRHQVADDIGKYCQRALRSSSVEVKPWDGYSKQSTSYINAYLRLLSPRMRIKKSRESKSRPASLCIEVADQAAERAPPAVPRLLPWQARTFREVEDAAPRPRSLTTLCGPRFSGKSTVVSAVANRLEVFHALRTKHIRLPNNGGRAELLRLLRRGRDSPGDEATRMQSAAVDLEASIDCLIVDVAGRPGKDLAGTIKHLSESIENLRVAVASTEPLHLDHECIIEVACLRPHDPGSTEAFIESESCEFLGERLDSEQMGWITSAADNRYRIAIVLAGIRDQPGTLAMLRDRLAGCRSASQLRAVIKGEFERRASGATSSVPSLSARTADAIESVGADALALVPFLPSPFNARDLQLLGGVTKSRSREIVEQLERWGVAREAGEGFEVSIQQADDVICHLEQQCQRIATSLSGRAVEEMGRAVKPGVSSGDALLSIQAIVRVVQLCGDEPVQRIAHAFDDAFALRLFQGNRVHELLRLSEALHARCAGDPDRLYFTARWASTAAYFADEFDASTWWSRRALDLAESPTQRASALNIAAAASLEHNGMTRSNLQACLGMFEEVAAIYERLKDHVSHDTARTNCMLVHESLGDLQIAKSGLERLLNRCADRVAESDPQAGRYQQLSVEVTVDLASVYLRLGDISRSQSALARAVRHPHGSTSICWPSILVCACRIRLCKRGAEVPKERLPPQQESSASRVSDLAVVRAIKYLEFRCGVEAVSLNCNIRNDLLWITSCITDHAQSKVLEAQPSCLMDMLDELLGEEWAS